MTGKRPYRCHVCGARVWVDETALRFPASAEKPMAPGIAGADVPVPDFQLEDAGTGARTERASVHMASEAESPVPSSTAADSVNPDPVKPEQPVPPVAAPPIARRERSAPAEAIPAAAAPLAPTVDEDTDGVPDFGEAVEQPVSTKVTAAFHHSARNKSVACPACGDFTLYRSHARDFGERLRKAFTHSRPYRCHRCGWRGWTKK